MSTATYLPNTTSSDAWREGLANGYSSFIGNWPQPNGTHYTGTELGTISGDTSYVAANSGNSGPGARVCGHQVLFKITQPRAAITQIVLTFHAAVTTIGQTLNVSAYNGSDWAAALATATPAATTKQTYTVTIAAGSISTYVDGSGNFRGLIEYGAMFTMGALEIDLYLAQIVVTYTPAATTTTLTSSINPSVVAQPLTLTATVSAGTGTVQFADNGVNLGAPVAVSGGTAQKTLSFTLGTHPLSAVYSGDSNYATSTGTLSQVVNSAGGGGHKTRNLLLLGVS